MNSKGPPRKMGLRRKMIPDRTVIPRRKVGLPHRLGPHRKLDSFRVVRARWGRGRPGIGLFLRSLADGSARLILRQCGAGEHKRASQGDGGDDSFHNSHFPRLPQCALPRTLSEMLAGKGFGVSMRPRTGRTIRK